MYPSNFAHGRGIVLRLLGYELCREVPFRQEADRVYTFYQNRMVSNAE